MKTKAITRMLLTGIAFTVFGTSLPALAGTESGRAPFTNISNAVFYSFEDTLQGAIFTISGKININDQTTVALRTADGFWTGTAQISLDETEDDGLSIITNLQHAMPPNDAATHGLASPYTSGGTILAENFDDTGTGPGQVPLHTVTFAGTPNPVSHPPHTDVILSDSVSFTKATLDSPVADRDEITNWTYTLQVSHVPEPAPFTLFGIGLLGLLGYFQMKSRLGRI